MGAPLFYGEQRGGRVFIYQRKQVGLPAPELKAKAKGVPIMG